MEVSSGNVFADLELPDAAELDTKVRLAVAINRLLSTRRLTQAEAAAALSINQPKVSALKHYKLEGYSVERLMGFLTALGSDIEIRIRPPQTLTRTHTGRGWLIARRFRRQSLFPVTEEANHARFSYTLQDEAAIARGIAALGGLLTVALPAENVR
jgi:predicted XRE-type DNA-binding protein